MENPFLNPLIWLELITKFTEVQDSTSLHKSDCLSVYYQWLFWKRNEENGFMMPSKGIKHELLVVPHACGFSSENKKSKIGVNGEKNGPARWLSRSWHFSLSQTSCLWSPEPTWQKQRAIPAIYSLAFPCTQLAYANSQTCASWILF